MSSYPNIKAVLWLSLCFFVIMFAYYSAVSVYSKVLKDAGYHSLGFYSLATLYVFFGLTCFVAPSIASMGKMKRILQVAALQYGVWMFIAFVTTFDMPRSLASFLIIFASAIIGIGNSLMWVTGGKYLVSSVKIIEEKSGLYNGLFWTITLSSQIAGYLYNSLILGYSTPRSLFMINTIIVVISFILFGFLPELQMPPEYIAEKESPADSLKSMLSQFKDIRIVKMYGIFINSALASAIGQAMLVPFYCSILKDEPLSEQLRISSLIMVIYGFGAMFGGQFMGFINDKFGGGKAVSKVSVILHILIYGSLFACNEVNTLNILCFISGFLTGAADSTQITQISMMFASEFTKTAELFAVLNVFKGIFMSANTTIASLVVTKEDYRLYYLIVLIFNVLAQLIILFTFQFKQKATNKTTSNNESEMMHKLIHKS